MRNAECFCSWPDPTEQSVGQMTAVRALLRICVAREAQDSVGVAGHRLWPPLKPLGGVREGQIVEHSLRSQPGQLGYPDRTTGLTCPGGVKPPGSIGDLKSKGLTSWP